MRFSADRAALAEAVRWVTVAVPGKPNPPALAGLLVIAEGETITLRAHDFDTVHEARVPAAIEVEGEAVVSGLMTRDLLGALKGAEVAVEQDGPGLTLKAGRSTYRVNTFTRADYPTPPAADDEKAVGEISADELRRVISSVAHAADDSNPVTRLKGIRLEADAGKGREFRAVALKSSTIAVSRTEWPAKGKAFVVQMPLRGLAEAVKGLVGEVTVSVGQSLIRLADEARTVTLRLYGEAPADWAQIVPPLGPETVTVEAESLLDSAKRASLTCQGGETLFLDVADGEIVIRAGGEDIASGVEYVEAKGEGRYLSGYTPEILVATLGALPPGPVTLAFGNAPDAPPTRTAPLQITREIGDFLHVVMPRRS